MRASRLVLVIALAAVGCAGPGAAPAGSTAASASPPAGSDDAPPASQPPAGGTVGNACELLTEDEILEVTGHPATGSKAVHAMGIFVNGCEWEVESGTGIPAQIVLGVLEPGGKGYWERYFEPFLEENGAEPIEGLGDVAIAQDPDVVMVVSGDALVSLQYLDVGPGASEAAVELTRKVVARIGG